MMADACRCELYEPDGTPLGVGTCQTPTTTAYGADVDLLMIIEQGGRVVERCLFGPVRDVRLRMEGRGVRRAQVARVFFDPKLGRVCALHLESAGANENA